MAVRGRPTDRKKRAEIHQGPGLHLTPDKQAGYMTATEFQSVSALQTLARGRGPYMSAGARRIRTLSVTRNLSDRKPARTLEKFRVEIDQHRLENCFALGSGRVQSLTFKFRCRENAAGLTAMDREPLPLRSISGTASAARPWTRCERRALISSAECRGSTCGFRELWHVTTPCRVRDRESLSSQMSGGATRSRRPHAIV